MEPVIQPIDRALIERELSLEKFIGKTLRGKNYMYEVDALDSPSVMQEIGRLREISFRLGGGGTGKAIDIDRYDTDPQTPYKQLIVWDPQEKEIIGGYRFILCDGVPTEKLATAELFNFSQKFIEEYLPFSVELGRSFIQPNYQSINVRRKSVFALDNLWDGLAALIVKFEKVRYFFGKVTMYTTYNRGARDILLNFLNKYFPDHEGLVKAKEPLDCDTHDPRINSLFEGSDYKEGYKALVKELKEKGEHVPPLINSYMNLSPSMKIFESSINKGFGGVEETGLLIDIADIYPDKINRHVVPLREWVKSVRPKWWIKKRQGKSSDENLKGNTGHFGIRID